MKNLFIVFTPFQLHIAQEIIVQEKLSGNVLLKGYVGDCTNSLEIYDCMKLDEHWEKEYLMPNVGSWFEVDLKRPLSGMSKTRSSFIKLNDIIFSNDISDIYMGEMNNMAMRVIADYYSEKGVGINFFEEGSAHYYCKKIGGQLAHRPFVAKCYALLFDAFLYKPLFNKKYGRWKFVNAEGIENTHIDRRFSIIPRYNETFDYKLVPSGVISLQSQKIIEMECKDIDVTNSILFLDQPIYEVVPGSLPLYIDTLSEYLDTLESDTSIIVKYHPRETDNVKLLIENKLRDKGRKFVVISKEINLPVEYYMKKIEFKQVVNYFTSSAFYNGYLFKHVQYVYLIENFYKKCKESSLPQYKSLEHFINLHKQLEA